VDVLIKELSCDGINCIRYYVPDKGTSIIVRIMSERNERMRLRTSVVTESTEGRKREKHKRVYGMFIYGMIRRYHMLLRNVNMCLRG